MRFNISRNDAVLALIAEMKARAADPLGGKLTADLCALTLQNVLPMIARDVPKPAYDEATGRTLIG